MKKLITFTFVAMLLLTGCKDVDLSSQLDNASASASSSTSSSSSSASNNFKGETGMFIPTDDNGVTLEAAAVSDGKAHFYNTMLASGEPVYFFIVKSPDGKLRAAANGCQVCGNALQGFRQEGDYMVCNTCGNRYHLDKVATEKGGCNPAPISPNLEIENGMINISNDDLKSITHFFS